jgi:hypothetical protein
VRRGRCERSFAGKPGLPDPNHRHTCGANRTWSGRRRRRRNRQRIHGTAALPHQRRAGPELRVSCLDRALAAPVCRGGRGDSAAVVARAASRRQTSPQTGSGGRGGAFAAVTDAYVPVDRRAWPRGTLAAVTDANVHRDRYGVAPGTFADPDPDPDPGAAWMPRSRSTGSRRSSTGSRPRGRRCVGGEQVLATTTTAPAPAPPQAGNRPASTSSADPGSYSRSVRGSDRRGAGLARP